MPGTRDALNAFLDTPEVLVPNAQSGPLAGLSLAVKDIYDVAGLVTGCGNPDRAAHGRPAARTAPSIQRLLDAGARFAGKTQTDELAFSLMGQNAHFAHPVNSRAPDRVTGGSSSGSAAAVAGGLADIATGSDTGGSIRAPASFCGLIGLRITHGAISLEGTMPLAASLDTFGWFAKDIGTYGKVGRVLLGAPPSPLWGGSSRSDGVEVTAQAPLQALRDDQNPLSVSPFGLATSPPLREGRGRASSLAPVLSLRDGGRGGEGEARDGEGAVQDAKPVAYRPLTLPSLDALLFGPDEAREYARMSVLVAEMLGAPRPAAPPTASIDELYWCFRKTQAKEAWAAHGEWLSSGDRKLGAGVRDRFAYGATLSLEDMLPEGARRKAFREELRDLLGDDGVLLMPTVPGAAPKSDSTPDEFQAYRERALRLLCWSGLSGFPQITLPLGTVHGAPFGISLLGPPDSDLGLIALGKTILSAAKA